MLKPTEQNIVLEMDVLHDVIDQFGGPAIERLPRSACLLGQGEAVCKGLQTAQQLDATAHRCRFLFVIDKRLPDIRTTAGLLS